MRFTTAEELGELRAHHNAVYRSWSYQGKLKIGEQIDIHHCLPTRMHFQSVLRSSPEAKSLPPSYAKIPALRSPQTGPARDHAQEVKQIIYILRPEMRPKKIKVEKSSDVSDDVRSNLSGILLGRTPVTVTRSTGASSPSAFRSPKGHEPELDDQGICFFAQEILKRSKCETLAEAFRVLDTNGSGSLSLSEFDLGLRSMDLVMVKEECRRIFKWLDMDKQGSISLTEWNRLDSIIKMLQRSGKYQLETTKDVLADDSSCPDEDEDEFPENTDTVELDIKEIVRQRRSAIVHGLDLGFTKKT